MQTETGGWEIILAAGAEGGCITLFGYKKPTGLWLYHVTTDETTLLDLLEEEERFSLSLISKQTSRITDNWEEAVTLLSRYPWIELSPMRVHVEFREKILTHIESRTGGIAPRWKKVCAAPA